jgi:hypothetical protein
MRTIGLLAVCVAMLAGAAHAQPAPSDRMAGVYKHRFSNGTVDGGTYQSEDILEIVPRDPRTAYVRLHLEFYNGHSCDIYGIATRVGDRLTYHGPNDIDGHPCVLSVERNDRGIWISEDHNQACRAQTCGARGAYGVHPNGEPDFKPSERREIRYLERLLKSSQYAEAVAEYEKSHQ